MSLQSKVPGRPSSLAWLSAERVLWGLLAILLAAVLAATALKVRPLLYPEPILSAPLDPACDLAAAPCTARFPGGGTVTLDVTPRGIPPVVPLRLAVAIEGLPQGPVQVDFAGVDMDMGYNRPSLAAAGPGLYRGEGMLPICVRARMDWEARVLIATPDGLLAAPFRFAAGPAP